MSSEPARRTPVAMTIAGSDSGGGAGIQADLKAFARCGVHGTCAITAITAQNTVGVWAIEPTTPEIVLEQVRAVTRDIGVDAVKVGMLGSMQVIHAVAQALDELPAGTPVVVDPVMVAESGARLLEENAQQALIAEILPRASVLTPNVPEALVLVGERSAHGALKPAQGAPDGDAQDARELGDEDAERLAQAVLALGPRAVVLTGGHRARAVDLFCSGETGEEIVEIAGERHPAPPTARGARTHLFSLPALPVATPRWPRPGSPASWPAKRWPMVCAIWVVALARSMCSG